jgi:hypothetical protein
MPTADALPTTVSSRSVADFGRRRLSDVPLHDPQSGWSRFRPRPDNAIYDLADALEKLRSHRFQPMQNPANRGYFEERARQEGDSALGQAMRRWLNPNDGAAAGEIEANPLEVGLTRTRCVATC